MIYLYVKTHTKTGLKYLGKTISKDPYKYPGSGKIWKRHLRKHGTTFTTEILLATENKEEIKETGLFFSKLWNIVSSKEWANLIEERGDGNDNRDLLDSGKHNFQNSEVQRKIQLNRIKNGTHNLLKENKKKFNYKSRKGCPHPTTAKRNLLDTNPFRDAVPCVDIHGKSIMVSKEYYYNQTGPKNCWQWVHTKSKEAKCRKLEP